MAFADALSLLHDGISDVLAVTFPWWKTSATTSATVKQIKTEEEGSTCSVHRRVHPRRRPSVNQYERVSGFRSFGGDCTKEVAEEPLEGVRALLTLDHRHHDPSPRLRLHHLGHCDDFTARSTACSSSLGNL
ncbi:hypothetical protein BHM03_00037532 [Ensete ventricosum]|uniref:Uncharacterized protein n=1 Tax=Ensete ventricosum TaxID=4639 RepID=A0A445MJV6_ENSVE|nr:hypothetical protein BHM03_00037532 [Ensete ventricosum]